MDDGRSALAIFGRNGNGAQGASPHFGLLGEGGTDQRIDPPVGEAQLPMGPGLEEIRLAFKDIIDGNDPPAFGDDGRREPQRRETGNGRLRLLQFQPRGDEAGPRQMWPDAIEHLQVLNRIILHAHRALQREQHGFSRRHWHHRRGLAGQVGERQEGIAVVGAQLVQRREIGQAHEAAMVLDQHALEAAIGIPGGRRGKGADQIGDIFGCRPQWGQVRVDDQQRTRYRATGLRQSIEHFWPIFRDKSGLVDLIDQFHFASRSKPPKAKLPRDRAFWRNTARTEAPPPSDGATIFGRCQSFP
ncbi:hypothetical protein [Devosia sp. 63-57]|uniref:hypothetical protein n=1 Tax=Devosia sp. 63-57 TaxID=1895751 RepID=UPI00338F4A50